MLSNQILHKAVQDIKRITGLECAIWDIKGICLVMTNERMIGLEPEVTRFCETSPSVAVEETRFRIEKDMGMFLVHDDEDPCYILVLKGNCPHMEMAGRLGISQLENLLFAYKEKMDKNRFIQNLILD
ncbi:MAG: PucR family transcriptional regulator, partial [Lachnospiraceae bacterium]|nr:PucR family transcriptional regulator [Lachnospiraceae bacterium]